jgi:hypothetical protein
MLLGQSITQFPDTEWQLTMQEEGVLFSTKRMNCETIPGKKPLYYSFLRIQNTSTESKKIAFNFGLAFDEGCSGCDDHSETHVEMTLSPGETVEGNCSFDNHLLTRLIVNPNLAGGWKFKSELITYLTINKQ